MTAARQARAISLDAFQRALVAARVPLGPAKNGKRPQDIAVAVSGGVDSMALAHMCRQLEQKHGRGALRFLPVIVDHGVREGSGEEAGKVARNLGAIGFADPVLLRLRRLTDEERSRPRRLESTLRTLRMQALGIYCRDHSISTLLLGHHQDDQAETVLMRIVTGYTGDGLQGISPYGDIPECFGLYGVHRSTVEGKPRAPNESPRIHNNSHRSSIQCAHGGVKIHRPLLPFGKNELRQTCLDAQVEWVEDATNTDRTFTLRNAVRHLQATHKLPTALQKRRLLQIGENVKGSLRRRDDRARSLFAYCHIPPIDLNRAFRQIFFSAEFAAAAAQSPILEVARFLQILALPISPVENPPLDSFVGAAQKLVKVIHQRSPDAPGAFTAARVLFSFEEGTKLESNAAHESVALCMQLSRETYQHGSEPRTLSCTASGKPSSGNEDHSVLPSNEWCLWDGRYWIKVSSESGHPVMLHHFGKLQDRKDTGQEAGHEPRLPYIPAAKKAGLTTLVPQNKLCRTLPVLVMSSPDQEIVVPSLGVRSGNSREVWRWEIKYKRIDDP